MVIVLQIIVSALIALLGKVGLLSSVCSYLR